MVLGVFDTVQMKLGFGPIFVKGSLNVLFYKPRKYQIIGALRFR